MEDRRMNVKGRTMRRLGDASITAASRGIRRERAKTREKEKRVLVFAYGSNLNGTQMRARCPSARREGRATLHGHALTFGGNSRRWGGGVANVQRWRGGAVSGVLYELSVDDLRMLDRFEGCPFSYRRSLRIVVDEAGRRLRAHVYVQMAGAFAPPGVEYLGVLLRAYKRFGFDRRPLAAAVCGGEP
jgi:hypothetical protein